MSDLIEITDEERAQLEHAAELLEGALSSPTGWINSTAMLAYDTLRSLANRKPVEDGRLLRRVEAFLSSITEWDGPSGDELDGLLADVRAALDQGGSDE